MSWDCEKHHNVVISSDIFGDAYRDPEGCEDCLKAIASRKAKSRDGYVNVIAWSIGIFIAISLLAGVCSSTQGGRADPGTGDCIYEQSC